MKKRYFLTILLTILFIPIVVFAEDKDVEIKSVEFIEKSDTVVESTPAKVEDSTLKFDLKFLNVGDYAKYILVVKNNTNLDLLFDETNLMPEDKSVGYELEYLDNKLIKSNAETTVYLKVMYSHQAASTLFRNSIYDASNEASLNLSDNFISIPNTLKNIGIIPLIIIIGTLGAIIYGIKIEYSNKKVTSMQILVIGIALISLPKMVDALKLYEIPISSKIIIEKVKPKPCTYEGNLTTGAQFIEGQYTYRYHQQYTGTSWNYVQEDGWGVTLTDKDSTDPVTSPVCSSINDKPIVSMSYMFANSKTTSINLDGVDTSHVVNMNSMFNSVLVSDLDLSSFNTSNVTNMSQMFMYARNLKKLYLRHFDISNVEYINDIFFYCSSLEELNLDEWDFKKTRTYNVGLKLPDLKKLSVRYWKPYSTASYWGSNSGLRDSGVEEIDATGWDLSSTTDLSGTFYSIYSVKKINGLDTWDTSTINNMYMVFENCESLEELDLSAWDTSHVTNISYMFGFCYKMKKLNVSTFDTSNVTSMQAMFENMYELEELDVSDFDTSKATNFYGMFYENYKITKLDLSNWDFSNVTDISYMFYYDVNLRELTLPTSTVANKIKNIHYTFKYCYMLGKIDLSHFDFSSVTSYSDFLYSNYGIIEIKTPINFGNTISIGKTMYTSDNNGYSSLPTNNSTSLTLNSKQEAVFASGTTFNSNMGSIIDDKNSIKHFKRADELPKIVFKSSSSYWAASSLDSGYPIYMWFDPDDETVYYYSEIKKVYLNPYTYSMFSYFQSLETIDTSDFDSSRSTTLSYFVKACYHLKSLDISHFDTSNVTDFYGAFKYLYDVHELDFSGFDTSKVGSFGEMMTATGLRELDLSSFDLTRSSSTSSMITDMVDLTKIKTPKQIGSYTIALPTTFVDDDGNQYTKIDSNTPTETWLKALYTIDFSFYSPVTCSEKTRLFDPTELQVYGNLPVPEREGYTFKGWYTEYYSSGVLVTNDTPIIKSNKITLYPAWEEEAVDIELVGASSINSKFKQLGDGLKRSLNIPNYTVKHVARETDASKVPTTITTDNILTINKSRHVVYAWFDDSTGTIYYYSDLDKIPIKDARELFDDFRALESVDLSGFDFSLVTDYTSMFMNNVKLKTIDLSNIDLSGAETMSSMFSGCTSLEKVKFGVQNTANLTNISYLFSKDHNLTSYDLKNLNTSNVTEVSGLFDENYKLTSFSFSGIDFSSLKSLPYVFRNCINLKSVDFTDLNGQITSLYETFYGCTSLENLDLSSLDLSNLKSINYLCNGCTNLKSVNLSTVTGTLNDVGSAFKDCKKLETIDMSTFIVSQINSSNYYSASTMLERAFYLREIKTPRGFANSAGINLPSIMYYQGNNTGTSYISSSSPTGAVMRNRVWS